jgi:hypothetical protein
LQTQVAHAHLVYIREAESETGQAGFDFFDYRVYLAAGVAAGFGDA